MQIIIFVQHSGIYFIKHPLLNRKIPIHLFNIFLSCFDGFCRQEEEIKKLKEKLKTSTKNTMKPTVSEAPTTTKKEDGTSAQVTTAPATTSNEPTPNSRIVNDAKRKSQTDYNQETHIDHMFEILPDAPNEDYENLPKLLSLCYYYLVT